MIKGTAALRTPADDGVVPTGACRKRAQQRYRIDDKALTLPRACCRSAIDKRASMAATKCGHGDKLQQMVEGSHATLITSKGTPLSDSQKPL